MTEQLLQFNAVSLQFGDNRVLDELSLQLAPGMILGLLGRNGAGKTTLLRTAVGLLTPQSGEVMAFSQPSSELSTDSKGRLGYVPQQARGYEGFTVAQALMMHRSFYPEWDRELEISWLQRFDLAPKAKVDKLSVGQRQLLALIMAMAYRPKLLILDEPAASLDPIARREFMCDLFELTLDSGSGVIFSSHIASDIERVASHVAIQKDGNIALFADLDSLRADTRIITLGQDSVDLSGFDVLCQNQTTAVIRGYQGQTIAGCHKIPDFSLESLFVEMHR